MFELYMRLFEARSINFESRGSERAGMLGMTRVSANVESGHIMTKRDHHCGEFIDSYDWNS